MNCHQFHERLARYEEGEMTPEEGRAFEDEVKLCAHMAGYHTGFRSAVNLIRHHCDCAEPTDHVFPEDRVAFIMTSVRQMLVTRQ